MIICILSYKIDTNRKLIDITEESINSALMTGHDILLLDDGSNLEATRIPMITSDKLKIIRVNYDNISKAFNHICRYAFYEHKSDMCLIMNNDVILCDGSVNKLMNLANNPEYKKYGIIYGPEIYDNRIEHGYLWSCFLFRKELYEKLGEFDERIRFSTDWDYVRRVKKDTNYDETVFYFKDFIVNHQRSTTKKIFEPKLINSAYIEDRKILQEKWNCY